MVNLTDHISPNSKPPANHLILMINKTTKSNNPTRFIIRICTRTLRKTTESPSTKKIEIWSSSRDTRPNSRTNTNKMSWIKRPKRRLNSKIPSSIATLKPRNNMKPFHKDSTDPMLPSTLNPQSKREIVVTTDQLSLLMFKRGLKPPALFQRPSKRRSRILLVSPLKIHKLKRKTLNPNPNKPRANQLELNHLKLSSKVVFKELSMSLNLKAPRTSQTAMIRVISISTNL